MKDKPFNEVAGALIPVRFFLVGASDDKSIRNQARVFDDGLGFGV